MATSREYEELLNRIDPETGLPLDESTFTDEELQQRIGAYKGLGETGPTIDKAAVERWIDQNTGRGEGTITIAKPYISDFVVTNRRLPDVGELRDILKNSGIKENPDVLLGPGPLRNFLTNQDNSNFVAQNLGGNKKDYRLDIKRINDLLASRGRTREEEQALDSFLEQGPQTLSDLTGEFVEGERKRGIETLNDLIIPEVRQGLNVRGLLDSGDLSSEVLRAAGEVLSPIEQLEFEMRAADEDFFKDAAYQATLKKTIQGQEDLGAFLDSQRSLARNEQENRFQSGQQAIRDNASLAYFQRQNQRQLDAQESRLRRDEELSKRASRSSLYKGIGTGVGTLAGLGVAAASGGTLTPLAAGIGMGVGGTVGGVGADVFSKYK